MNDLNLEINIIPEIKKNSPKINKNRIGRKIGRSTIIGYSHTESNVNRWKFKCECGNEGVAFIASLKRRIENGGYCKKCFSSSPSYWKKPQDLTGKKFGELTVLRMTENRGGHTYWDCKCSCGNEENIAFSSLKKRQTKTCWDCYVKSRFTGKNHLGEPDQIKNGDKFNSITVLSKEIVNRHTIYNCKCDCGEKLKLKKGNLLRNLTCKKCAFNKRKGTGSFSFKDLSGTIIKDWEILELSHFDDGAHWKCKNINTKEERVIRAAYLGEMSKRKKKEKTLFVSREHRNQKFEEKYKDYLNKKVKNYTIIGFNHYIKNNILQHSFKCQCKCGKITNYSPYTLLKTKVKNCYNCWDKGGKNNPNYDESISNLERINKRRLDPNNKIWKKDIYKRDNYTCQVTFKKGEICAHHLYSWKSNIELRNKLDNGITLLQSVHNEFHKRFGYRNNTKEQFDQFIKSLSKNEIDAFPAYRPKRVLTEEEKSRIVLYIYNLCKYQNFSNETSSDFENSQRDNFTNLLQTEEFLGKT